MSYSHQLVALLVFIGVSSLQAAEGDEAVSKSIYEKWKTQETEIVTGQFEIREFDFRAEKTNKIDRAQFDKIISEMKDFSDQSIKELKANSVFEGGKFGLWPLKKLVSIDGKSVSNESSNTGFKLVAHQGAEIITDSKEQCDIYIRGYGVGMVRLDSIRYIPKLYADKKSEQIILLSKREGVAEVLFVNEHVKVDMGSGYIRWWSSQKNDGKQYLERYQFGAKKLTGGILIPEVTVEAFYDSNRLVDMSIRIIDQAVVNEEVDSARFIVAVQANVKLIDHRIGGKNPVMTQSPRAQPDAIKAADLAAARQKPEEKPDATKGLQSSSQSTMRLWPWFLGAAIVIACIGAFMIVSRAKGEATLGGKK